MRKAIVAVGAAAALMLTTPATASVVPVIEPTSHFITATSCGPFWLRLWLTFTQPSYVGYLVGRQAC